MTETVHTAVDNLLSEPCKAYKEQVLSAVHAAPEEGRRLAISRIEDFLRSTPSRTHTVLGETLVALRRTVS